MLQNTLMKLQFHLLLFMMVFEVASAQAQTPPSQPILKIETGMHTARINDIRVDGANRILVTASDDGTARAWRLPNGELINTFRVPIVPGQLGAVKTAAISPDGSVVALGGHTFNHIIYLFDVESGQGIRVIKNLPDHVAYMEFSPNGRYLVATLEGANGILVWRTEDYTLFIADNNYLDATMRADFDSTGRLVTTSYDDNIRLYNQQFQLQRWFKLPPGQKPTGVAFSPDGKKIAVGYSVATGRTLKYKIDVFDGLTLDYLFSPKTKIFSLLPEVAWSSDGEFLYAGGVGAKVSTLFGVATKTTRKQPVNYLYRWGDNGEGKRRSVASEAKNVITRLVSLHNGGIGYVAIDPFIGTVNASFNISKSSPAPNFATIGTRPKFSVDGNTVQFNYDWVGKLPARFSLDKRFLNRRTDKKMETARWSCKARGLKIQINLFGDKGSLAFDGSATLNGNNLADTRGATECSIAPDKKSFAIGTNDFLILFSRQGEQIWKTSFGSAVYNATIINNQWLVAGLADGTIRWVRLKDGREIVALFAHTDQRRWVLWSTSGHYDSSPDGDELLGWHLNRGEDVPEFLQASQLKHRMYRPDIIDNLIQTRDIEAALALAPDSESSLEQLSNPGNRPPVFSVVSPQDGDEVNQESIPVELVFKTSTDLPQSVVITVNGRQLPIYRPAESKNTGPNGLANFDIPLDVGVNLIEIVAQNQVGESSQKLLVEYSAESSSSTDTRGTLYLLSVGVNDYSNLSGDLEFAAPDAIDFHALLIKQSRSLYREVKSVLLADGYTSPSRVNIENALELFTNAKPRDTVILFLAGHGVNENSEYYFLPTETTIDDEEKLVKTTVVNWRTLQRALVNSAGRRILLVDTCHAGNAFNQRLVKDSSDANIVVFTSTDRVTLAQERKDLGHGVFTYAILQGLMGKADLTPDHLIKIKELDSYVSDAVVSITAGEQLPVLFVSDGFRNFTFAKFP